jgi:hypothetical protein
MNGTKIFRTVFAVALVVFIIPPIASAQQYADILDGKWFKAKLSVKGYAIAPPPPDGDGETVLGKGSGASTAGGLYLHMSYDIAGYTVTTCMRDDRNYNVWHKNTSAPISTADIYGATYPQVWDFKGIPLVFYDGITVVSVYPTLYTKITAEGSNVKSVSISNVSCSFSTEEVHYQYGKGSCKLTGSLIPADKVATTVPVGC